MNPQKRQRYMFALLAFSVVFGLYMKPWQRRVRPTPSVPTVTSETTATASQTGRVQPAAIVYATAWPESDPFTRISDFRSQTNTGVVEPASLAEPTLDLQGIMAVDGQVLCVIAGETRGIGSIVDGWRLDMIELKGIWVSQGGLRHFVPLP